MCLNLCYVLVAIAQGQNASSTTELLNELLKEDKDTLYGYLCNNMNFCADPCTLTGQFPFQRFVVKSTKPDLMARLVAKGAPAVDELLAHLDDVRESRLVLDSPWTINYVHAITDNGKPSPGDLWDFDSIDLDRAPQVKRYTITTADIAYYAIGQIVNRWYQPIISAGGAALISSPVLSPSIKRDLRMQWGGLTAVQLKQSLRRDVLDPDTDKRAAFGIRRLSLYFPQEAESVALSRVNLILRHGYHYSSKQMGGGWGSFFDALQTVASDQVLSACSKLLEKEELRTPKEQIYGLGVLELLQLRAKYIEPCRIYCRKCLAEKPNPLGMDFRKFLEVYDPSGNMPERP